MIENPESNILPGGGSSSDHQAIFNASTNMFQKALFLL